MDEAHTQEPHADDAVATTEDAGRTRTTARPRRSQPCPLCERPFTLLPDLENHLRQAHKLEPNKLRHPTRRALGPRVIAELVGLVVVAVAAVLTIVFRNQVDSSVPYVANPLLIGAALLCLVLAGIVYFRRAS